MPKSEINHPITHQQCVPQQVEGQHRFHLDREQVLARLWEIANLSPEMTRNSVTGQVKVLAMIIAMQNFIPDRKTAPSEKQSPAETAQPDIYEAAWLRKQRASTNEPEPRLDPVPDPDLVQQEDSPGVPEPEPAPGAEQAKPPQPYVPVLSHVPDATVPFFMRGIPYPHRR